MKYILELKEGVDKFASNGINKIVYVIIIMENNLMNRFDV